MYKIIQESNLYITKKNYRFVKLFDLCIDSILPSWTYGTYFQNLVKSVKKILILSSRRISLLERILNLIPTTPCSLPLIHIDRHLAFAYRYNGCSLIET